MSILAEIARHVEEGDHEAVRAAVGRAFDSGETPRGVLDGGLLAGMSVVGERFRVREIFLPDVLLAAKALYAGLDLVRPRLAASDIPSRGTVVLGSVRGDLHDIGKNLVGIMLRGAGFEVVDLGNDVAPERFVSAAKEHGAAIIGCSALLTTTMPVMREVVDLVKREGLGDRVRVIVGGAPVTAEFAAEIGASGYAFDAASAVERVKAMTS